MNKFELIKKIAYIIFIIIILNLYYNIIYYYAYIKGQQDIFNQDKNKTANQIAENILYKRDSLKNLSFFGYQIKK